MCKFFRGAYSLHSLFSFTLRSLIGLSQISYFFYDYPHLYFIQRVQPRSDLTTEVNYSRVCPYDELLFFFLFLFVSAAVEAELSRQNFHLRGPEELQQATRFLHDNGKE